MEAQQEYRRTWIWWSCWSVILGAGVILKAMQPTVYLFGSRDDDELMVRMAKGFLDGHWSSNWASTGAVTLAKPVGYSLFLAGAHFMPWSPVLSVYLLYLVGAVLIAWSWKRLSDSRPMATVILAMLVFSPSLFASSGQRIYRDVYIDSIATVAIGLAFVVTAEIQVGHAPNSSVRSRVRGVHRHRSGTLQLLRRCLIVPLAVVIGVALGIAAVTKPTYQWMVIAIAAPLVYPVARRLTKGRITLASLLKMALAVLLVLASGLGVVEFTKRQNEQAYRVAVVEDFSSGALARVWKLWAGVEAGRSEPYVPITSAMREAVYRISPSAAELRPWLESPNDAWRKLDCESPIHICNDAGDWFQWDLRYTAVSLAGIDSVQGLQTYFNRIADDIARACSDGRLTCSSSPVLATGLPRLDQIPIGPIFSYTGSGLWQMARDQLPVAPSSSGKPTPAQYALWSAVVPSLPSFQSAGRGQSGDTLLLRGIVLLYGLLNLILLATFGLGVANWIVRRIKGGHGPGRQVDRMAGCSSAFFLLSTVVGMATLAVFAAALGGGGYTAYYYWSDFAVSGELLLVFGAFAVWPVVRGPVPTERPFPGEPQEVAPLVGSSAAPDS